VIIGNKVLENSGFHMRKNFFEICPKFGQTPKMFASIALGQRGLKNVGLKGRETVSQPGAPNY
jgi:hypothetical protein